MSRHQAMNSKTAKPVPDPIIEGTSLKALIVEQTFAWIMKYRRRVRDCELLANIAETSITIAASETLIRQWS